MSNSSRLTIAKTVLRISLLFLLSFPANAQAQKWRLVWTDEFNGANGTAVDNAKWTAETGGSGWGNQELEYYTNSTNNAYQNGKGSLVIKAISENPPNSQCWYGPCLYSSARLVTKGKFDYKTGRFEARIKIPAGQGLWPAFWMLGNNIDQVSWPTCGEIDIMENIGREPSIVHGTIHGPGYSGGSSIGAPYTLAKGKRFSDDFHIYKVEWEPNVIRWYVDGNLYQTRTPSSLPAGTNWVYDHPFFLILNVAVGGGWPGNPDQTTVFPQAMMVDYVRVYKLRFINKP
ncbi:MAG: glycoside hydrolase family 16 protein [Pyrinomonadaceae bacterium]